MAITIKGIRVEGLDIKKDENGGYGITQAEYSLISSADRVLAKQTIGGYNGLKVEPSASTVKALNDFMAAYKDDVRGVLGLELD